MNIERKRIDLHPYIGISTLYTRHKVLYQQFIYEFSELRVLRVIHMINCSRFERHSCRRNVYRNPRIFPSKKSPNMIFDYSEEAVLEILFRMVFFGLTV